MVKPRTLCELAQNPEDRSGSPLDRPVRRSTHSVFSAVFGGAGGGESDCRTGVLTAAAGVLATRGVGVRRLLTPIVASPETKSIVTRPRPSACQG